MHHVAWGITCAVLVAMIIGLFAYGQTLASDNKQLADQLRQSVILHNSGTCKVSGEWSANTTKQLSVPAGAMQRNFLVHLPRNFVNGHYYPLVMFYTGKGEPPVTAETTGGLDNLPAVVVYPFGTIGKDNVLSWEGAPYSSGADDVAFTSSILDRVEADLCIDHTRIYATGFSNGGGLVSLLSCKLADRFAAYAIDAAALYYPSGGCTPPRPISLINIHGDNDKVIPYGGSAQRKLPAIDDWIGMRAKQSGCGNSTTIPVANTIVTTWDNCKNGAVVQNVRVTGGGHSWGMVPSNQLWQFLTRFSQ
jgi:polyhydroxybutyrate depolymerase